MRGGRKFILKHNVIYVPCWFKKIVSASGYRWNKNDNFMKSAAAVYWSRMLCWQEVLLGEGTCSAGGGWPRSPSWPLPSSERAEPSREGSQHASVLCEIRTGTTTLRSLHCNYHDYSHMRKQDVRDWAICSSSQSCLRPKNSDSEIRLLDLNPGVTSH